MAKLWLQDGHLVMINGVLCYQDECPCGLACTCCPNGGFPSTITVSWMCLAEEVQLHRTGPCTWATSDIPDGGYIELTLVCSGDPLDPWWGLIGIATSSEDRASFDERYDGAIDCAEDILGKTLTGELIEGDCSPCNLSITGVG